MKEIRLIFIEPLSAGLLELKTLLKSDFPDCSFLEKDSTLGVIDALSATSSHEFNFVFCHASSQDHLVKHLSLLKLLKSRFQPNQYRILLTSGFTQLELVSKLQGYGFTDVCPEPLEVLKTFRRVSREIEEQAERIQKKVKTPQKVATKAPVIFPTVRMVGELNTDQDQWLLQRGSARRIGDRWLVKLRGPRPEMGTWSLVTSSTSLGSTWEWIPHLEAPQSGRWHFRGLKCPVFTESFWNFIGQTLSLEFVEPGKPTEYKFKSDEKGGLIVAQDSSQAFEFIESEMPLSLEQLRILREKQRRRKAQEVTEKLTRTASSGRNYAEIMQKRLEKRKAMFGYTGPQIRVSPLSKALTHLGGDLMDLNGKITGDFLGLGDFEVHSIEVDVPRVESIYQKLGAIGICLLVCELTSRQDYTPNQMSEKLCRWLISIAGASRAELWFRREGVQWVCAATDDGTDGTLIENLDTTQSVPEYFHPEVLRAVREWMNESVD